MSTIQSSFYHASIDFFHRCLDYQYALTPQSTDSISSPMGLGSDSEPHIECELRGNIDAGIEVAEHDITTVTSELLEKHGDLIAKTAGNTEHFVQLLHFYRPNARRFPRVSLDEALELAEVQSTPGSWDYAVAPQEVKVDVIKGRKLTRIGERVLIKVFKGAV
ncbi:MAG: hypothetical protein Q9207_003922 [Kuettlingeria erythrocarpa]